MTSTKFASLDLFSGIGGNAFALRSIATPALYCDNDPGAIKLLARAMANGFIPEAPVHGDVTTLTASAVYAEAKMRRPLLVSASWPCQGASMLGKRKGMEDPRSGLLRDVCAIVQDAAPDVVVLENVFDVVNNGSLEFLVEQLGASYAVHHKLTKACDLGFWHERKRFFAVLIRKGFELKHSEFSPAPLEDYLPRPEAEPPRTIADKAPQWAASVKAFGNTVVPACLYYSTLEMLGFQVPPKPGRKPLSLVLDPARYAPPPGTFVSKKLNAEKVMTEPMDKDMWPTPRATDTHGCHHLTPRSSRDLTTMVRFERSTPDAERGFPINPAWVAHLMGFPPGYLSAAPSSSAVAPAQPPYFAPPAPLETVSLDVRGYMFVGVHKTVLALGAPGLAFIVDGPVTTVPKGVAPATLKLLLTHLYTGALDEEVADTSLEKLQRAAERFGAEALVALCKSRAEQQAAASD